MTGSRKNLVCFGYGEYSHFAGNYREHVRCFKYGNTGHKPDRCLRDLKGPNSGFINRLSIPEHGFQFVLKIL